MSISWEDHKELVLIKDALAQRYELLADLGGGAFGKIFKLKDKSLERECALKVLNIDKLNESKEEEREEKKARFIKEAKAYAKCPHSNIVPIFDIGGEETFPYFLMKYINGESLKAVIAKKSKLGLPDVLKISSDVLSALECIHQQKLIHRDLKPANIMIEDKTGKSIVIDLGIAKDLTSNLTVSGTGIGTPVYMAPEQFRDCSKVTQEADIYSFGVVLFEMLTGEIPFKGRTYGEIMLAHLDNPIPNIRQKNPNLPAGIEDIIFKAMAKEPEDRYEDSGQFREAIRRIVETSERIEIDKKARESIKRPKKKVETPNNKLNDPVVVNVGKIEPPKTKLRIEPDREFHPKKDYEREYNFRRKDHKIKFKYIYITAFIVLAIAAFFFLKSYIPEWQYDGFVSSAKTFIQTNDLEKANEALNKAKKIKDTNEIERLLTEIAGKRTGGMKREWDDLKTLLKRTSSNKDKLQRCREFLVKHEGVPANNEKTAIFSEINNSISNLERSVQLDEEYQKFLSAAREYVKKGDYPKAVDTLGRATKNRGGITSEIAALSNEIREKQIEVINGEQYQKYIHTVNNLINSEDYEGAKRELDKARKINNSDEVKRLSITITEGIERDRKNGKKDYTVIKDKINLSQYLVFRKNYPNSDYLQDLKDRLKKTDKNLPPEKYWDKTIKLNSKGFYEFTFGSVQNPHIMIYIPSKKFWVDKYEVSWKQYRSYLREQGKAVPPIKDNKYKPETDEFPATTTFQEAAQYGDEYGLRLPDEEEWENVAGKGYFSYPWGNELPDAGGVYRANFDTFEDGYPGTAPVRSFEKFASPFGVVNMSGNVWEWVQGSNLKGGGFLSEKDDMAINKKIAGVQGDKWGFRCIKEEK